MEFFMSTINLYEQGKMKCEDVEDKRSDPESMQICD